MRNQNLSSKISQLATATVFAGAVMAAPQSMASEQGHQFIIDADTVVNVDCIGASRIEITGIHDGTALYKERVRHSDFQDAFDAVMKATAKVRGGMHALVNSDVVVPSVDAKALCPRP